MLTGTQCGTLTSLLRYKASLEYGHTNIPLQARTPPFTLTMLRQTSL